MRPENINKMIKQACKDLGIVKPITCYSLKRNGVTLRRLRGESDVEIQHAARWTTTKQLRTYDMSNQDDAFKIALQKRGLINNTGASIEKPLLQARQCPYCNETIGFSESTCPKCKHLVSRDAVLSDIRKDDEIIRLRQMIRDMADIKQQLLEELERDIRAGRSG